MCCLLILPGYALNRTTVNCLLNFLSRSSVRIKYFGFSGAVEVKYAGTARHAETTTDTRFLVDRRVRSHRASFH